MVRVMRFILVGTLNAQVNYGLDCLADDGQAWL